MQHNLFITHLYHEIKNKCTIFTKILLIIFILSTFIPFPLSQTDQINTIQTLVYVYVSMITTLGIYVALFLFGYYIDFISEKNSNNNIMKKIYTFMIIVPIIDLSIFLTFNMLTPFQIITCIPTMFSTIFIFLEKIPKQKLNVTKFEKIFFKK